MTNVGHGAPSARLHSIDGLRSLAVALVLVHHLTGGGIARLLMKRGHEVVAFCVSSLGTSGVELFFVLSGVVLARPHLEGQRPFHALAYLRRRVSRLFPPYLAAWAVTGAAYYIAPWAIPFTTGDWFLQLGIVRFGFHYSWAWWSLTVEVLFYLLVPLLIPALLWLPRRLDVALCLLATSIAIAALSIRFVEASAGIPIELSSLGVYAPCFTAGLLLARVEFPRSLAYASCALGALLLCTALLLPVASVPQHTAYGLIYLGLVSRSLDATSRATRALSHWHLVWLGERSYSLFLIHCAAMLVVGRIEQLFWPPKGVLFHLVAVLANAALSLFAAMVLFSTVERKFARGLATADFFWPWHEHEHERALFAEGR